MNHTKYQTIVKRNTPKEDIAKNALIAFFSGGVMGIIAHSLTVFYQSNLSLTIKEANTLMIVTLIFVGCLLTCFGFFDTIVNKLKCGLVIPITGFAHSMQSAALEHRKEGLITGIGANMFKLGGTVIIFGVVSAYIFGLIRYMVFGA